MKTAVAIVFFILFFMAYLSAAEMVVRETITESVGDIDAIRHSVRDANGNPCALLKVQTDLIPFDKIESPLFPVQITNRTGEVWIYLSSGEKRIYFSKDGYAKLIYDIPLRIESSKVYSMRIIGSSKNMINAITVTLKVNPPEALVNIDDSTQVDISKPVLLEPGIHKLQISHSAYRSIRTEIEVSTNKAFFEFNLQPLEQVMLTIKSVPSEADIIVDNIPEGKTNKQIFKYPGSYNLRLQRSGYDPVEEIIAVSEEGQNTYNYTLSKASSTLKIVLNPPDAQVWVDNIEYKSTLIDLSPGLHKLEIRKEGYEPFGKQIVMQKGSDSTEIVDLVQHTGKIVIITEPMEALVELSNGMKWEGSKMLHLPVAEYKVIVKAAGFLTHEAVFLVSKDVETELEIILKKETESGSNPLTPRNSDTVFSLESKQELENITPYKYEPTILGSSHKDTKSEKGASDGLSYPKKKFKYNAIADKKWRIHLFPEVKLNSNDRFSATASDYGISWAVANSSGPKAAWETNTSFAISAEALVEVFKRRLFIGGGYEYNSAQSIKGRIYWDPVLDRKIEVKLEPIQTPYGVCKLMLSSHYLINPVVYFKIGVNSGDKRVYLEQEEPSPYSHFEGKQPLGGTMYAGGISFVFHKGYALTIEKKSISRIVNINYYPTQYSCEAELVYNLDCFTVSFGRYF